MTVKVTGIQLSECWWGNYFAWPYRIALKRGLGCRERGGGGGGANLRLCYMSYAIIKHGVDSGWSIQIPYSGKLSRIGENTIFCGENFSGLVAFVAPKDTMPQNFLEKTFAKPWNSRKFFSLESFLLYAIRYYAAILSGKKLIQWSSLQVHIVTEAER